MPVIIDELSEDASVFRSTGLVQYIAWPSV